MLNAPSEMNEILLFERYLKEWIFSSKSLATEKVLCAVSRQTGKAMRRAQKRNSEKFRSQYFALDCY